MAGIIEYHMLKHNNLLSTYHAPVAILDALHKLSYLILLQSSKACVLSTVLPFEPWFQVCILAPVPLLDGKF